MSSLVILLLLTFTLPIFASCPDHNWHETVRLKQINDGDTITLESGRLVRFVGINTPEIDHDNINKSEPYALEAKALLEKYIRKGEVLHLIYDKEEQDKYGRTLAYVYSNAGKNLALLQLQEGFAKHWVIGENDKFWRCFQKAESTARLKKKGIWSHFKPLQASRLNRKDTGYVYITGIITEINNNGLKFTLDNQLTVSINNNKLEDFDENAIEYSLNQRLLLYGKLFFLHGDPKLTLYHPVQLLP